MIKGTVLAKLGSNMISLFIVFGLLYWVSMARLVRGQILTIKQNDYVLAARAIGTNPASRIIRTHILPNCLSVIIISVALADPVRNLYRELFKFLRSWCTGSDAVAWFPGERGREMG